MLKSFIKKAAIFFLVAAFITSFASGCGKKSESSAPKGNYGDITEVTGNPQVQIEMDNGDKMVLELYPEYAPETVLNFVNLVHSGFYDGLTMHRIIKDFMIQGGDPKGDGTGGSDKTIKGEFRDNGFSQNTLQHTKGVISMARSQNPDSASSQFFIVHGDAPHLDGAYAAFGKLISGEEVLDKIADTEVKLNAYGEMSVPKKTVKIKAMTLLDAKE